MAAQPGVAEGLDSLVCDGKTLRGSISETPSGAATSIAQVSLYSQSLGVAIAQTTRGYPCPNQLSPSAALTARKRTSTALHALAVETPTAKAKAHGHTGIGEAGLFGDDLIGGRLHRAS
jgi:hypothetical protein